MKQEQVCWIMSEEGLVKIEKKEEEVSDPAQKIKNEKLSSTEYSKFFRPGLEPTETLNKSDKSLRKNDQTLNSSAIVDPVKPLNELKNLGPRTNPGDSKHLPKVGFSGSSGYQGAIHPRHLVENMEPLSLVIRTKKEILKPGIYIFYDLLIILYYTDGRHVLIL